jgi:hypothetical protein
MGTHWDECWKAHRECCTARIMTLWSQYLSDGTEETLKKYKEAKQTLPTLY